MPEMTEEVYELIRDAVNISRGEQVLHLDTLKAKLLQEHPGKEAEVDQALQYWANREAATDSLSRYN